MKKGSRIVGVLFILLLIVSAIPIVALTMAKKENVSEELSIETFSKWTDCDVFQTIPAMNVKNARYGEARECGSGNYIIDINGTQLTDYKAYLTVLDENGFLKYCDNGETGIDEAVYTATYTKEDITVSVTHVTQTEKTYLTVGEGQVLSKHLNYDDSYLADCKEGAKTTLHMLELYTIGNSFVFQLKNGHFIINDGGTEADLPYLLDYLDKLAPEGEKPIVEAWIVSHAHGDHMGPFMAVMSNPEYADRLYVEGVYFNEPGQDVMMQYKANSSCINITYGAKTFKSTSGEAPKVYRMQMGQKYYFCDIIMEVTFSQEYLTLENYTSDLNESSTFLMYYVEGQKALLGGDGDFGGMKAMMRIYDQEYFKLDIFTNLHHAINVYDAFTDYCTIKTVLIPFYQSYGMWPNITGGGHVLGETTVKANMHLIETSDEAMTGANGTVVLTFPYKVGTATVMKPTQWIYNPGDRPEGFPEKAY